MDPLALKSALSHEHLLGEDFEARKHSLLAWLSEMRETARNNCFGVRMRMQASSVVLALCRCSPTEQRVYLRDIDSALRREIANYGEVDIEAAAAYYAIACGNHDAQGCKVRISMETKVKFHMQDLHRSACELIESLPCAALVQVRDDVDFISEGKGFLPFVLTGGTAHYWALASVCPLHIES